MNSVVRQSNRSSMRWTESTQQQKTDLVASGSMLWDSRWSWKKRTSAATPAKDLPPWCALCARETVVPLWGWTARDLELQQRPHSLKRSVGNSQSFRPSISRIYWQLSWLSIGNILAIRDRNLSVMIQFSYWLCSRRPYCLFTPKALSSTPKGIKKGKHAIYLVQHTLCSRYWKKISPSATLQRLF